MSSVRTLADFVRGLSRAEFERKLAVPIPRDHVVDEGPAPGGFERQDSYFTIRVAETFLRNGREYFRGFSPLAVLMTEFVYAQERRHFSFLVGSQALTELRQYVGEQHVEFRNTRVVGPVPYVGDDVSIFLGLCRTVTSDVTDHLFKLLETITKTFDTTGLTRLLDIAGPLRAGLDELLGMRQVELRLGHRVTLTEQPGDPYEFRPGYFAYANVPEREFEAGTLWVKDGRLHRGETGAPED